MSAVDIVGYEERTHMLAMFYLHSSWCSCLTGGCCCNVTTRGPGACHGHIDMVLAGYAVQWIKLAHGGPLQTYWVLCIVACQNKPGKTKKVISRSKMGIQKQRNLSNSGDRPFKHHIANQAIESQCSLLLKK